jgi:hypothetical protein
MQLVERKMTEQLLLPGVETEGFIFLPLANYILVRLILATESNGDVEITVSLTTAANSDS